MEMVLLDTNVVSFVYRDHSLSRLYKPFIVGRHIAISFQSVAELEHGVIKSQWSSSRQMDFFRYLKRFDVLHSNDTVCSRWAEVMLVRKAHRIGVADAWIAATALSYDLDLVTHNPKDFRGIPGLRVLTASK